MELQLEKASPRKLPKRKSNDSELKLEQLVSRNQRLESTRLLKEDEE
jgi:hypothetical protein